MNSAQRSSRRPRRRRTQTNQGGSPGLATRRFQTTMFFKSDVTTQECWEVGKAGLINFSAHVGSPLEWRVVSARATYTSTTSADGTVSLLLTPPSWSTSLGRASILGNGGVSLPLSKEVVRTNTLGAQPFVGASDAGAQLHVDVKTDATSKCFGTVEVWLIVETRGISA
jgi:hypothetical protein